MELYSTAGDYGLRTLSEPEDACVDIVFVHGLTGNRETTWTHKEAKVFWPQAFLARDLPNTRILTFGYDADIVHSLRMAGSNTLRDNGKSLAHDLALRRMRSRTDRQTSPKIRNNRPLIFVAHSLGGLVVEQALLISRGAAQQHLKQLLISTAAIAFMGTPHIGSAAADWAPPITRLANLLRTTNHDIVQVLRPGSEMLANLQQEFHVMLEDYRRNHNKSIEIFCFFEELPVTGIGKIVPDHSAILSAYPNRSIHADHMQMSRFSSDKDPGYVAVSDQLWLWVETLQKEYEVQAPTQGFGGTQPGFASSQNAKTHYLIDSGGGAIFQGHQVAGRDFNFNRISR